MANSILEEYLFNEEGLKGILVFGPIGDVL